VCGPNGEPIYRIPGGSSGGPTAEATIPKQILGDFNIGVNRNPAYPAPLCSYCRTNPANSLDHVDARIHGGNLDPKNLTPACGHCNPSKNNRIVPKNPPKGYTGTWPPPWWSKSMIQEWYLLYAG
jgi:5-methylcytosine-specific restriction endonuclease McrA